MGPGQTELTGSKKSSFAKTSRLPFRAKKIKTIFILYWFLLAYIMAALIWWYIALMQQNQQMTNLRLLDLHKDDPAYQLKAQDIMDSKRRKTAQYIGEGAIFFLLISAGAIFVYRSVNSQLKLSQQQQNFMIAITHELKTPISVTKLNLETLQKRKLDESQQQKLLQNTLQETTRMNALCNNLLLASQMEAGGYKLSKEELNLTRLIQDCVTDVKMRYPQRSFVSSIQDEVVVSADNLLVQMAVNNLLDNAIKYSLKDQPVTVELSRSDEVRITVKDEGPGIAEADKKYIFQKFYRVGNEATKRAKGTGLGLYLVDRIVAEHKGQISVTDNQPTGTVFTIILNRQV